MSNKNFIIVGDSILDRYFEGPVKRISPEAPCPIVDVRSVIDAPGGAANVAMNLVTLGHTVDLVTVLGGSEDDYGTDKLRACFAENVCLRVHAFHHEQFQTPIKNRVCDSSGVQLVRFDQQDKTAFNSRDANNATINKVEQLLNAAAASGLPSVLVLADYAKGVLTNDELVARLLMHAASLKIPSIVDPKASTFQRYWGATVIKPNFSEACRALNLQTDEIDAPACAIELIGMMRPGTSVVVVTDSSRGMAAAIDRSSGIELMRVPAYPTRQFLNAVGAGDTVTAMLAEGFCCTPDEYGSELFVSRDVFRRASVAAGVATGKLGTAAVNPAELETALTDSGLLLPDKLIDAAGAAQVLASINSAKSIVFTNGCFDLLHLGHIHQLQSAKKEGDILVVGLNSDESVKRAKGLRRPIMPIADRARALSALECVDMIVPFEEDTPEALVGILRPDVLVKGEDYRTDDPTKVAGGKVVTDKGGRLVFIPLLPGYNTTEIIERLTDDVPNIE